MRLISGYTLESCLHAGRIHTVWRGRRDSDALAVVVKYINTGLPSLDAVERLYREYRLLVRLGGTVTPPAVDFLEDQAGVVLVMADTGARTLATEISRGPFDRTTFIDTSIGLVRALSYLHAAGLLHRNVSTVNVLLDHDGTVRLADLDAVLDRTDPATFPLPPELPQMRSVHGDGRGPVRPDDFRNDYYALGCVLFEMLTGNLVRSGSSSVQVALRSPGISRPLAAIVLKLLAPAPEDRYQSLVGLEADLLACRTPSASPVPATDTSSRAVGFHPGRFDRFERFAQPSRLYGRSREITMLRRCRDNVLNGEGGFVMVCGPAGIGKTTLVNEVFPLSGHLMAVMVARFGGRESRSPHGVLAEAFSEFVAGLLGGGEADLHAARARLEALPPDYLGVLLDLVPDLALIVGRRPLPDPLPLRENQARLFRSVLRFLQAVAGPSRPLVLVMDDLHEADSSSIALVRYILAEGDLRHLLVVVAWQEDAVGANHPVSSLLRRSDRNGSMPPLVALGALSVDHVVALLTDMFGGAPSGIEELANLLIVHSGGNPFWIHTLLRILNDQGKIVLDRTTWTWSWDGVALAEYLSVHEPRDALGQAIDDLGAECCKILMTAACLGSLVSMDLLTRVVHLAPAVILERLGIALERGVLLLPHAPVPDPDGGHGVPCLIFNHHLVRDAVISLISEEDQALHHQMIGLTLCQELGTDAPSVLLFTALDHVRAGHIEPDDPRLGGRLAELEHEAARRAAALAAYAVAYDHAVSGIDSLGPDPWQSHPVLAHDLFLAQAESACALDFRDSLQHAADALLAGTGDVAAAAPALEYRIFSLAAEGNRAEAMAVAVSALASMGLNVRPDDNWLGRILTKIRLSWLLPRLMATEPRANSDASRSLDAAVGLLFTAATACFPSGPALSPRAVTVLVRLALDSGTPGSLAAAHASAVMQVASEGRIRLAESLARRTVRFIAALPSGMMRVRAELAARCLGLHWGENLHAARDALRACAAEAGRIGDDGSVVMAMGLSVELAFYNGGSLPQLASETSGTLEFCQRTGSRDFRPWLMTVQRTCRLLMQDSLVSADLPGLLEEERAFLERLFNSAHPALAGGAGIVVLFLAVICGEYGHALEFARRIAAVARRIEGTLSVAIYDWLYLLTILNSRSVGESERRLALRRFLPLMQERADIGPVNHLQRLLLVEAEVARVSFRLTVAEGLYAKAFQTAADNGIYADEILICLMAASFHDGQRQSRIALSWRRQALDVARSWGAEGLVSLLRSRWVDLRDDVGERPGRSVKTSREGGLDLATAMRAARVISGELQRSVLLENILRITMGAASASRGLLFLRGGDGWAIEAESDASTARVDSIRRPVAVTGDPGQNDVAMLFSPAVFALAESTGEPVLLDDATKTGPFVLDPYISHTQTRSLLCMPLSKGGAPGGMLWLEHARTAGLFTPARMEFLHYLAAQAVVALENARLYQHLSALNSDLETQVAELARTLGRQSRLVDATLESIPDALIACDPEGRLVAWNRRACDLFRIPPGLRRRGTPLSSVMEAAVAPGSADTDAVRLLERGGRSQGADGGSEMESADLVFADGRILRVRRQVMPGGGEVLIFREVTGELKREQELETARTAAERALSDLRSARHDLIQAEKMASLGELVAGVSHEINTPVGVTLTAASFLMERANVINRQMALGVLRKSEFEQFVAQATETTSLMVANIQRAADLINSFKQIAVDRSGGEKTRFRLSEYINDVLRSFGPMLRKAGHRLEVSCPEDLEIVSWPGALSQILSNFVTNAVMHAYDEGQKGILSVSVRPIVGGMLELVFADDGKGVSGEVRDRMFDPFFTTRRGSGGSGLGLNIVFNLVTGVLGGTITVDSEPGRGTRLVITMPVEPEGATQSGPLAALTVTNQGPPRLHD